MIAPRATTFDLRRALARTVFVLVAALILAPVWLGPALGSVVALLGANLEHHCACGMVRGKCGCEECQLQESERHDRRPSPVPVFRTSCTDDEAVDLEGALPATAAATLVATDLASPGWRTSALFARAPRSLSSREAVPPPTPPPRTRPV